MCRESDPTPEIDQKGPIAGGLRGYTTSASDK
jgi:hypothetical protein